MGPATPHTSLVAMIDKLNTVLHFENGSRKTIKVITFDKDLSVTKKAQSLIGGCVKTYMLCPKRINPAFFQLWGISKKSRKLIEI